MLQLSVSLGDAGEVHATSVAELYSMAQLDTSAASREALAGDASAYALALHDMVSRYRDPCVVVGWSMGAMVALECVLQWNVNIEGVVAVGSTARFCSADDYPHGFSEADVRGVRFGLERTPQEVMQVFIRDVMFPSTLDTAAMKARVKSALAVGADTLEDGLDYLAHQDFRSRLSEFRVPLLVLHGREDRIIPWQAGEFLSRGVPRGQFFAREGVGHALIQTDPAFVASYVRSFLVQLG